MIRSMTAFGRGEVALGDRSVTAEVRTVNGRHLDVRLKLPRACADLESAARALVGRHFARGKAEVTVRLPEGSTQPAVQVDLAVARRYLDAAATLRRELDAEGTLPLSSLLALPGVVRAAEPDEISEELAEAVLGAVEQSCRAAVEMRRREGEALEAELSSRLRQVLTGISRIEDRADQVSKGLRDRLQRRLASLAPEMDLDPARFDQEVVFYVDRMDVTEETVRLRSHCAQFAESLSSMEPVGRKLEFLLQELGREVNTVGSKVTDAEVSLLVVELKTELEKLREQILNIE